MVSRIPGQSDSRSTAADGQRGGLPRAGTADLLPPFHAPADARRLVGGDRASRIHIVGGSGMGKTTLAIRIGDALGLPVLPLDDIAFATRIEPARRAAACEIAAREHWVTEGIYLGWSDPIFDAAQIVIWLDCGSARTAVRRVVTRFVVRSIRETYRRPTAFFRPRSYARHLRELGVHVVEVRDYYSLRRAQARSGQAVDAADAVPTREATIEALRARAERTIRCGCLSDGDEIIAALVGQSAEGVLTARVGEG